MTRNHDTPKGIHFKKQGNIVMVGWMQAHAKYVETKINNTLRVSAPLRLCVKLKNKNARSQRRDGAKNKNPSGRDMLLILKWCQLPSNLKRIPNGAITPIGGALA